MKTQTIFFTVGLEKCEKSTIINQYIEKLREINEDFNIQHISSNDIRKMFEGGRNFGNEYIYSEDTFNMVFDYIERSCSFPVNADFIFVETNGNSEDFRNKLYEIAKKHYYNLVPITFEFKNNEEYFNRYDKVKKFKSEVLPKITKSKYNEIIKIKSMKDEININIENIDDFKKSYSKLNKDFVIVGDIHSCYFEFKELIEKFGFKINSDFSLEKPENTELILVGDVFDRGENAYEMLEFVSKNDFIWIKGSHDEKHSFYITNNNYDGNKEYSDYEFLNNNKEKFLNSYKKTIPFFRIGNFAIVNHSPCKNEFVGKFNEHCLKKQIRSYESNEEIQEYIETFGVKNSLYRIVGHKAVKNQSPYISKNFIMMDTGCVFGNRLSGVLITKDKKMIFKSVESKKTYFNHSFGDFVEWGKTIEISDKELKRIEYLKRNNIEFISGTICPANKKENELESIESAIEMFRERGVNQVIAQKKYMGSRANFYFEKSIENCKFVSRNGYIIKKLFGELSLEETINKTYKQFKNILPKIENKVGFKIEKIIFDGELMKWNALGKGLIDEKFKTFGFCINKENKMLFECNFEEKFNKFFNEFKELDFSKLNKDEIKNIQNSQSFISLKNSNFRGFNFEIEKENIDKFNEQVENFGSEGETIYKPFGILKIYGEENKVMIRDNSIYPIINDDECVIGNLENQEDVEKIINFFNKISSEKEEGIVIKPLIYKEGIPCIKVRNKDYLRIIYGYDYLESEKYTKLIQNKNINKKLRTSIKEFHLGIKMLENEDKTNIFAEFLKEEYNEKSFDPRL